MTTDKNKTLVSHWAWEQATDDDLALAQGIPVSGPSSQKFNWFFDELPANEGTQLRTLYMREYDAERERLRMVRQNITLPQTESVEIIELDALAQLIGQVYGVAADRVSRRLRSRMDDHDSRWPRWCEASNTKMESVVTAAHILTGHCHYLQPPRDTQDHLELETLINDLCYRGFLKPGKWLVTSP